MDPHSERPMETTSNGSPPHRIRVISSTPRQFREDAAGWFQTETALVLVARSRSASACLAAHLDATRRPPATGGQSDAPSGTGIVAVYDAMATPANRRDVLERFATGQTRCIILDPWALADRWVLAVLRATPGCHWIVQDAQAAFIQSGSFQPELLPLLELLRDGTVASADLHVSPFEPQVAAQLAQMVGVDPHRSTRPAGQLSPVSIRTLLPDGTLETRSTLADVVGRLNTAAHHGRALFVIGETNPTVLPTIPTQELASVAEEIGFRVPDHDSPGATNHARLPGWLDALAQPATALTASDPEVVQCLPDGPPVLYVRFQPPTNAARLLDECVRLAETGGGTWAFAGTRPSEQAFRLSPDQIAAIGALLVETCGDASGPVPLSAEQIASKVQFDRPLEQVAPAIDHALRAFAGAGLLRSVHRVHFMLEVADAHRFQPPHIDIDPRYVSLREKYGVALDQMDLLQSVQYRLEARPPKDLRVVSRFLGYSIHELNALFSDLSSDGIVLCRLYTSGSKGNIDFQIEGIGHAEAMTERLDQAVADATAWLDQVNRGGWELITRLARSDGTVTDLLNAASGGATPDIDPDFLAWLDIEAAEGGGDGAAVARESVVDASAPSATRGSGREAGAGETTEPPIERTVPADRDEDTTLADLNRILASPLDPDKYDPDVWNALLHAIAALSEQDLGRARSQIESTGAPKSLPWQNFAALVSLLATWGDPDGAAAALEARLQESPSIAASPWLPRFLNAIDYRVEGPSGDLMGDLPEPVQRAALLLPAIEETPDDVSAAVRTVGFEGTCRLQGLGVVELEWNGSRIILTRNNLDPDTEARLWVAIADSATETIPPSVMSARLSASYSMVAGLADPTLTKALATQIVRDDVGEPAGAQTRHILARARALVELGRGEEALELMDGLAEQELGELGDLRLIRIEALVSQGEHLEALGLLPDRPSVVPGSPFYRVIKRITTDLQTKCEEQTTCNACVLKESRFCPSASTFLAFVLENPLGESPSALVRRLTRRAEEDVVPDSPKQLTRLVDAFGNSLDEAIIERWVSPMEVGDPGTWLALAQKLLRHGRTEAAMRIVDRVEPPPENPGTLWRLARLKLAGGRLLEALTLAVQLEAKGGRTWSPDRFCSDLEAALGRGWEERVDTYTGELDADAAALLQRLADLSSARKTRAQRRARLDAALDRGSWRELKEALDAYQASDPKASKDRLVREAIRRIDRRGRRLEQRVRQVLSGTVDNRTELERLARDTEALGLSDAHARVQEALSKLPKVSDRPRRAEATGGRQGRPGRQDGERRSRRQPADSRSAPPKGPGDDRRGGSTRRQPSPRIASEEELLSALKDAENDRARIRMTMSLIEQLVETDAKRALKVLRSALATFQYPDVMDRPLARLVRSGRPADELLPRLRRLLEGYPGGRGFQATIGEISTREHPEPWKQVLAQLKLKP